MEAAADEGAARRQGRPARRFRFRAEAGHLLGLEIAVHRVAACRPTPHRPGGTFQALKALGEAIARGLRGPRACGPAERVPAGCRDRVRAGCPDRVPAGSGGRP